MIFFINVFLEISILTPTEPFQVSTSIISEHYSYMKKSELKYEYGFSAKI